MTASTTTAVDASASSLDWRRDFLARRRSRAVAVAALLLLLLVIII